MNKDFDFCGWATRNNIRCTDGVMIKKDAFIENDGTQVPLVWNHDHSSPENVIGHAQLENRPQGVYAYCYLNDSPNGIEARNAIEHGDVRALSIYANNIKKINGDVIHGSIKELSVVLAGANSGAYIENVIKHGEEFDNEILLSTGDNITIAHSQKEIPESEKSKDNVNNSQDKDDESDDITRIFNTLNDEQKRVVYAIIGASLDEPSEDSNSKKDLKKIPDGNDPKDEEKNKDIKHSNTQGGTEMKHNVFDKETTVKNDVLSHADGMEIIKLAKRTGVNTLKNALELYAEENEIEHADTVGGFIQTGTGNVTSLFPEYQEVRPGAPELITNDQGWISTVMSKVHKSPISRIRTSQVDIRNIDSLRAKGYKKGNKKAISGNFKLVRRTTDPQTIYVRNSLHKDDITDITDFDYVKYLCDIDMAMLNEELAVAMLLGDGRDDGDEDKIAPEHIRPIWLDDELYTIHVDLDVDAAKKELQGTNTSANFGENYIMAEAMINTVLHAREKYKGTGTPDFFCTPRMLNVMLLARDLNGRRIYNSKAELASALNVGDIYTAEQFEGKVRKTDSDGNKQLLGIICNLADYSLGATKGGEVAHYTQFDIDFNQEKSLIETRCSGALTRVYSAIAIEQPTTATPTVGEE